MAGKIRKSYFTILELIVAMGVFAVMMLALMQLFSSAQKVWTNTANRSDKFESAKVVMDILSGELMSAYYEENHSAKKTYFIMNGELELKAKDDSEYKAYTQLAFATVKAVKPDKAASRLTEVYYRQNCNKLEYLTVNDFEKTASNEAALGKWVALEQTPAKPWIGTLAESPFRALTLNAAALNTAVTGKKWESLAENVVRFYVVLRGMNKEGTAGNTLLSFADMFSTAEPQPKLTKFPFVVDIVLITIDGDAVKRINAITSSQELCYSNFLDDKNELKTESDIPKAKDNSTNVVNWGAVRPILLESMQTFTRAVVIDRSIN